MRNREGSMWYAPPSLSPYSVLRIPSSAFELFRVAPPPLGYDPAPTFHAVEHPDFGVLKLSPWRVELGDMLGRQSRVWRA